MECSPARPAARGLVGRGGFLALEISFQYVEKGVYIICWYSSATLTFSEHGAFPSVKACHHRLLERPITVAEPAMPEPEAKLPYHAASISYIRLGSLLLLQLLHPRIEVGEAELEQVALLVEPRLDLVTQHRRRVGQHGQDFLFRHGVLLHESAH